MTDFFNSIDRVLSTCYFCLTDETLKILESQDTCEYNIVYQSECYLCPHSFRIVEANKAIKPFFQETFDSHYSYLLLDTSCGNVYCVTKQLGEYLRFFFHPIEKFKLGSINLTEERKLYFNYLIEYGFLKKYPISENSKDNLSIFSDIYASKGFNIVKKLGTSDSHVVYKAVFRGKLCVLKQITNKDKSNNLVAVINTLKRLGSNPYMPKLLYFDEKQLYYAMEYVEGTVWSHYIKQERTMEEKESGLHQILAAIAYLHSRSIIHGDVHGAQFVVMNNGRVKVIDFDLISDLSEDTASKEKGGALEYLAPEIIGDNPLHVIKDTQSTFESEVYRLGVLMYITFFEMPPFYEMTWRQMYRAVLFDDLSIPNIDIDGNTIPHQYLNAIRLCLLRSPSRRLHSAIDVLSLIS